MWREMSLLFAVALLCGLLGAGESTTCTPRTMQTCKKSLFMKDTCKDGKCACVSGYVPGPFGCQKKQTAKVTAPFETTMETGSSGALTCSPKGLDNAYEWYKGGVKVDGKISQLFTIDNANDIDSGDYTCKGSVSGILTDQSTAFTVNVETNPTTKPLVTGMPTNVVAGMQVAFKCTTTVNWKDPTYGWVVNGETTTAASAVYTHTVVADNGGHGLKCIFKDAESQAVTFPNPLSTTLTGVHVVPISSLKLQKGEMLSLSCKLTGGFPDHVTGDTTIAYKWKKDGEDIAAETDTTYVKNEVDVSDSGSYTCLATFGGEVESAAVVVEVAQTMKTDMIQSAEGFLKVGYYNLTCEYDTVNTLLPVTYSWTRDSTELLGVTDKTLQFNVVDDNSVDGKYVCKITGDEGSVSTREVDVQAEDISVIEGDTPTITHDAATTGVGDTIVLTCKVKYYTPGVQFIWTLGDIDEEAKESNTYEFTSETDGSMEFKCKYIFREKTSQQATETFTPKYILEKTITVNGFPVTGTLKPVEESKVKLTCEVTKSGGAGTVAYQWKTDGTDVEGQTSKNYEHTVGAAGTAHVVKCEVTVSEVTEETDDVTITAQATVEKPKVVMVGNAKIGAGVSLHCISVSYVEGATFQWQKGDDVIPGATSYLYEIKSLADSHQGDYKCKVTVGAVASDFSDAKSVSPSVQCTWASDCDWVNMNTTVCEKNKCECLSGYTMNNFQCFQCLLPSDCDGVNMNTTVCEKNKCECLSGYTMNNFQCFQCLLPSDCDGANMDTTVCENYKCKCLSGYTMNNFQCSGSSTLVASLLLLVWTAIARQLF